VEHVSSRQNDVVKRFREIVREGRLGDAVLLDGPHLIADALGAGVELEVVAFARAAATGQLAELAERCAASRARVITAPDALFALMSPVKHAMGVVAIARLAATTVEEAIAAGSPQLVMMLDGVQDPGNVGAVVRAGEACGATALIAGPGTADPFGWKALRGSMGSAFRLPVARTENLGDALLTARAAGLKIFATVPRGGTPLRRAGLTVPAAIILGGEGGGVTEALTHLADETLTIEMRPSVESLNVGVAAALVVYEASRQRTHVAVR